MEHWVATTDLEAYAPRATPWLALDPVSHNVLLTAIEQARRDGATDVSGAVFAWHECDGVVDAAASRTPPHGLCVPAIAPRRLEMLAAELHVCAVTLSGVGGPASAARAFADAWSTRTGCASRTVRSQRFHRLDEVRTVHDARGGARAATEADVPRIAAWLEAFVRELGLPAIDCERWARTRWDTVLLWTRDDEVVALAAHAAPVHAVARVGPVWTPPGHRGRGYATSLVAALSRRLLAAGNRACVLYTDAANAATNAMYARIGYRAVFETTEYAFAP